MPQVSSKVTTQDTFTIEVDAVDLLPGDGSIPEERKIDAGFDSQLHRTPGARVDFHQVCRSILCHAIFDHHESIDTNRPQQLLACAH
jgi:hypothetical protein